MWVLTLMNNDREQLFYVTQRKKEFVVGRANTDIVLQNDSSISRKHCSISIINSAECPVPVKTRTAIFIKDLGSKYGTYVQLEKNWEKINLNEEKRLTHGSYIRFGIIANIWCVEYKPLIVWTSNVPEAMAAEVKKKVASVDGLVISNFDSRCAFLITPSITLTLKVLMSLIHGIPIVTPAFLDLVCKAVEESTSWSDAKLFLPSLAESAVRVTNAKFDFSQNRKNLFKDLIFYAGTVEQVESLKTILESAGGNIEVFDGTNKSKLLASGAILLDSSQSRATMSQQTQSQANDSQWTDNLKDFLSKNNRRIVPEREIPLAIVYNSIEKHCNPCFMEFNLRSGSVHTSAYNLDPQTIIEDFTEEKKIASSPALVVNASLTQKNNTQADKDEHLVRKEPETVLPQPSLQPTTSTVSLSGGERLTVSGKTTSCISNFLVRSHKRSASVDIFEEDRPNKKPTASPFETPIARPPPKIGSSTSSNSKQSEDKLSKFWGSSGKTPETSNPLNAHPNPSEASGKNNGHNPFGGALATLSGDKRKVGDSQDDSFERPFFKKPRSDVIEKTKAIPPPQPRPDLIPRVPRKPPVVKEIQEGFIDMSYKKEADMDVEALGKTIIMMSMVSASQLRQQPNVPLDPSLGGKKNVKVFKKQTVFGSNQTFNLGTGPSTPLESWF